MNDRPAADWLITIGSGSQSVPDELYSCSNDPPGYTDQGRGGGGARVSGEAGRTGAGGRLTRTGATEGINSSRYGSGVEVNRAITTT